MTDPTVDRHGPRGPAPDDPFETGDPLARAVARLRDVSPSTDLWPGIESRLAPRGERGAQRVISFTLPQLALAATLLIAASAAVSWVALGASRAPAPPGGDSTQVPIQAVVEPRDALQPDVQRATFADAQYDAAVADLERILREESQRLDPQTVMVIERNLRGIDEAIRESRAALDADPANTYLNSHLADARRRKLELLRRAAGLSTTGG
jgi:hypothetical protein